MWWLEQKISSGEGLAKLGEMIAAQGGDARVVHDVSLLPKAQSLVDVTASRAGYVRAMKTSDIGEAARLLGAGRQRKEDAIDPAVGIVMKKSLGEFVQRGEALCTMHVGAGSDISGAQALLTDAIELSDLPAEVPELTHFVVE